MTTCRRSFSPPLPAAAKAMFLLEDSAHRDSLVFAVVALALFAVAWLASWIPARRATRINPVEALRND